MPPAITASRFRSALAHRASPAWLHTKFLMQIQLANMQPISRSTTRQKQCRTLLATRLAKSILCFRREFELNQFRRRLSKTRACNFHYVRFQISPALEVMFVRVMKCPNIFVHIKHRNSEYKTTCSISNIKAMTDSRNLQ